MTEKKKIDEKQIWMTIMTVIPVVILMNVGNLADDGKKQFIYSVVFGSIGGTTGGGVYFMIQDKSRLIKILASVLLLIASGLVFYFVSQKIANRSDIEASKEKEWITQTIGNVEFDSPKKLELSTNKIPKPLEWFYEELEVYSNNDDEKNILFMHSKILVDTLSIDDTFSLILKSMFEFEKKDTNWSKLELDIFTDEQEASSSFTFYLNDEKVTGFGYMFKKGTTLDAIWLMPIKKGFSKEFIEEFEIGIFPNNDIEIIYKEESDTILQQDTTTLTN